MSGPLKPQKCQKKTDLINKYLTPPKLLSLHYTFTSLQGSDRPVPVLVRPNQYRTRPDSTAGQSGRTHGRTGLLNRTFNKIFWWCSGNNVMK